MQTHRPATDKNGFIYMLAGDTGASDTDPWATMKTAENLWVGTGSHVMMIVGAAAKTMAGAGYQKTTDDARSGSFPPVTPSISSEHPIDAGPSDPQSAGDFRGPDAFLLEPDDLGSLPPNGRHTPLVAPLSLGFGDAFPLAFQHGFPLRLPTVEFKKRMLLLRRSRPAMPSK